ncbi:MAG TPA: lipid-binding SYLF domain-containing protein [Pyrinomonadaceae bacterium]|nr:lipid-binding SYLF domain-containing protein [Pyrinomonadaceae bacterium]
MKKAQAMLAAVCVLIIALSLPARTHAQNKFTDATERSEDAGRIISLLAAGTDSGLPKELIDKAEAIGVFPKVDEGTMLLTKLTQGYGVISARAEDGWTAPAFYQFVGSGYGNPFARGETYGVILLFMSKDAVEAFEKGGVPLKGERKALAGPVGTMTDERRKEIEGAHILAYTYFNGKLKGAEFGQSFWKKFMLDPDNKINKPLYGIKGREVLAGKKVAAASLPTGIPAYREALQKYFGAIR